MRGGPRSKPVHGCLLAGALFLVGFAFPQAQPQEASPVSLSASLSSDSLSKDRAETILPEAILFPGDSLAMSLEVAVHPNEPKNWENLQVRLSAALPEDQATLPVKISARLSRSGTLPLVPNKWYPARELGISPANPHLRMTLGHQGFTREPLVFAGEVQSPRASIPATTARFPVNCAALDLTDIADPAEPKDDQPVAEGGAVFLTHLDGGGRPLPMMPRLVARVYGLPKTYTVRWRFASRYSKRGNLDTVACPSEGSLELPATESWRIFNSYFGNFFGGDASVSFEVIAPNGKKVCGGSRNFRILSKNAVDTLTKEYIKTRSGEFWFAWAIAQHESRQWKEVFNQFNERGRLREYPNFGPPDGWGVFQIDSARGQTVSTREVWDLRQNVFAGIEELKTAKADSHRYVEAIRRTYPRAYDGLPPSYTPPGCRTTLTWEEASIMQLFNGAAVVLKLKNTHGTFSYYRSCWRFLPNNAPGKRWVFVRNRNNYVYKVVKHEIEGEMGTTE